MSSVCNWSSVDDEILIGFVRNHEGIYNVKSKDYRKTQLKQNWWREIGEILHKSDSDCSKRWCYIRDYYVRRRGKPGTGSSGEAAKKRADLLSFLDSLNSPQSNSFISNVIDEDITFCSVKMESSHDDRTTETTNDDSERAQTPEDESIAMENIHSEDSQSNSQEIEYFNCDSNDHKRDDDKKHKNHSQFLECASITDRIQNRRRPPSEFDENDLFFGSMAKIVKKLPRYEQVQLRLQIGSLVGNVELRCLSNNSQ